MVSNGKDLQVLLFKVHIETTLTVIFVYNLAYEAKAKQADTVNQKLIAKYENLQKFIKLSSSSEAEIFNSLPKVQVTKFIQENRKDFEDLK